VRRCKQHTPRFSDAFVTDLLLAAALGPETAISTGASSFGLCIAKKVVYVETSIGFVARASIIRVKINKHDAKKYAERKLLRAIYS